MSDIATADARPLNLVRPLRPRELEDTLNHRLYHPLAWRLAKLLARTRLTPNQVSVVGGLSVVGAGIAYTSPLWGDGGWPLSAGLGLLFHMAWHVIDGADGDLARMTGRSSPRGEMVDGLCDYLSHFVLYLLLGALLASTIAPGLAWGIAWSAGIAHAVQATHAESQRRFYLYWVYAKPWLNTARPEARGLFAWLVALYLRVAQGTTPSALAIDRAVMAAAGDPPRLERLRGLIRAEMPPLLRLEKLLGPNSRAIALGLSMLLTASPLAYFIYGAGWLTVLLVVSIVLHNRAWRRLARRIEALG